MKISSEHKGRDFLFSFPRATTGNIELDSHITFHKPNRRLTLKTVSIKEEGKEKLPHYLSLALKSPNFQNKIKFDKSTKLPRELDLYGGKTFDLSNPNKITYLTSFALNLEKSDVNKLFKSSNTPDVLFSKVKDVQIPTEKNAITFDFGIAKNYQGNISPITLKYDDFIVINDYDDNAKYLIFIGIKYKFPDLKKKPLGRIYL